MSILFQIGSTDLTKFEDREKHNVNRADIYTSWTDGNLIEHREIHRTNVGGSVFLRFPREADFSAFLGLLDTARNANGYYPVTVWCSNTGTSEQIEAFLSVSVSDKWDVTAPLQWRGATVTIDQR